MTRIAVDGVRLNVGGQPILFGTTDGRQRVFVSSTAVIGSGTLDDPWPLSYALAGAGGSIQPGALVYLRGGNYLNVAGFTVSVSGTETDPITFRNYPGETPVLDGAIRAFVDTPATAWEVVSESAGYHVYRSTATFADGAFYGGFLDIDGEVFSLAGHRDETYLQAVGHNYTYPAPYYLGPGIAWKSSDQKIYVRLDNSTAEAMCGRDVAQVTDTDPRNQPLWISGNEFGLNVTGSHLLFQGIQIDNYYGEIVLNGGAGQQNVTLRNCSGRVTYFVGRLGSTDGVLIESCVFDAHMNSERWWVAWNDVKGGNTVADDCRKNAIEGGSATNVEIRNNVFREFFDGILTNLVHDWEVHHNTFEHTWDDAWQMYAYIYQIDFHHNHCIGAGPSRDGAGSLTGSADPGTVYIHHNVIDTTQRYVFWGRAGRPDFTGEYESIPHSTHGAPTAADRYDTPWKYYYNTVITGAAVSASARRFNESTGVEIVPAQPCISAYLDIGTFGAITCLNQATHEVYNNVFLVQDGRPLGRDAYANSGREIYDGNVYWHWGTGSLSGYRSMWRFLHTSTGNIDGESVTLNTPAAIRATQALADSELYYADGWDAASLAIDPDLGGNHVPTALPVLTGAVDLTATGWPDTDTYQPSRGAPALV